MRARGHLPDRLVAARAGRAHGQVPARRAAAGGLARGEREHGRLHRPAGRAARARGRPAPAAGRRAGRPDDGPAGARLGAAPAERRLGDRRRQSCPSRSTRTPRHPASCSARTRSRRSTRRSATSSCAERRRVERRPRPAQRCWTTSVWKRAPSGPCSSCSTPSARPSRRRAAACARRGRSTRPRGGRCRWIVRSALMNRKRSNGSAALTPLPKSAVAARRVSGVSGSPGQQRVAQAHPHPPRAKRPRVVEPAHLHRRRGEARVARVVQREAHGLAAGRRRHRRVRLGPSPGRRGSRQPPGTGLHAQRARADDRLLARQQLGRQLLHAPAGAHDARAQRQRGERNRAQELETEARDAQLRARLQPLECRRSSAPPGAPPCSACGSHGPRACSVGTKRSPSAMKMALAHRASGWQPCGESPTARAGRAAAGRARSRRAPAPARPACAPTPGCAPGRA